MKQIYLTAILILPLILSGQIELIDTNLEFDGQKRSAFYYQSPSKSETQELHRAWKRFMRKEHDVKLNTYQRDRKEEYKLEVIEQTIPAISPLRLDLYTEITDTQGGLRFIVFAAPGYDIYLGPGNYPDAYEKLKSIVKNFLIGFYSDYYPERIKELNNIIKGTEDQIKDLKKENNKKSDENKELSRKITEDPENAKEYKDEISTILEEIEQNNDKIKTLKDKINRYNKMIDELKDKLSIIENQKI